LETNKQILEYYGFKTKKNKGDIFDCYVDRADCETFNYALKFKNDSRLKIEWNAVERKFNLTLYPANWISADDLNHFHKTQERYINKLRYDDTPAATALQTEMVKNAKQAFHLNQQALTPELPTEANIRPYFESEKQRVLQKYRQEYPYRDDYVLDYRNLPPNAKKVPGIENIEMESGLARFPVLHEFFDTIIDQKKEIPTRTLGAYLERLCAEASPLEVARVLERGYKVPPKYLRLCANTAYHNKDAQVLHILEANPEARSMLLDLGHKPANSGLQTPPWLQNFMRAFSVFSNSNPATQSIQYTNKP